MSCQINNQSDLDVSDLNPLANDLMGYMQKKIGFNKPPSALTYQDDSENANNILGKTAFYNPGNSSITIFVTGRHPKDILRSLAHELVHHKQNEDGEFEDIGEVGEGYAQSNDKLRGMERQAYEMGNMCFRDWEDGYKNAILESIYKQQQILRRNKTMKIHKWKNNELNRLLIERFTPKKKINEMSYNDIVIAIMDHDPSLSHEQAYEVAKIMENEGLSMDDAIGALSMQAPAEEPGMGMEEPGMGMEMEMVPEEEEIMRESKEDAAFRKKLRILLEEIKFKEIKFKKKAKKSRTKRKITVHKRRK